MMEEFLIYQEASIMLIVSRKDVCDVAGLVRIIRRLAVGKEIPVPIQEVMGASFSSRTC